MFEFKFFILSIINIAAKKKSSDIFSAVNRTVKYGTNHKNKLQTTKNLFPFSLLKPGNNSRMSLQQTHQDRTPISNRNKKATVDGLYNPTSNNILENVKAIRGCIADRHCAAYSQGKSFGEEKPNL